MNARRLIVLLVSAAVLVTGAATASASPQLAASLVSKGKGTQTFEGGGLTYGTVARNATILVVNLAGPSDLSVTIKGKPIRYGGGALYTAKDPRGMAFKVSGSDYRLVIKGLSALNGINVWGTADFKAPGSGKYSLNGGPFLSWGKRKVDLGDAGATPPAGS